VPSLSDTIAQGVRHVIVGTLSSPGQRSK